jgi:hypothetical protein
MAHALEDHVYGSLLQVSQVGRTRRRGPCIHVSGWGVGQRLGSRGEVYGLKGGPQAPLSARAGLCNATCIWFPRG